ncbi:MAG: hypothetical protein PQJ58_04570, partial [Spirochaetales bacterium]|nr:hypothetical protein [Spirochaetales bacterium]
AFGKRPEKEFYRLDKDPHCLNNLAENPDQQDRMLELHQVLKRDLEQSGDPRMSGGGDEFDSYAYVGDDRHSWKALTEGRWEKQPF